MLVDSVRISLNALSVQSRRKFLIILIIQGFLAVLDLVGVAIFGAIGALAIRGVQSKSAGDRVSSLLEFLHLSGFTFQQQVAILGIFAVSILVLKTFFSIWITRRTLFFLANKGAELSSTLFRNTLYSDDLRLISRKVEEIQYAVGPGANALTVGTLGTAVSLVSDFCVVIFVGAGALIIDPATTIFAFTLFIIIAISLYKLLHKKAHILGNKITVTSIATDQAISNAVIGFRELYTKNVREHYLEKVNKTRTEFSKAFAMQTFLPNISKYVIEIALISGALIIAGIQFSFYDASKAAASLTLFLAAGSRVGPALLRFQQNLITIQAYKGSAEPTFKLINEFLNKEISKPASYKKSIKEFKGTISISNLSFSYPGSESIIEDLNLKVSKGEFLAIVGPSGAGKSTLIDLILGILSPQGGAVSISGEKPEVAIGMWPGKIAYVPQEVFLINGTLKENIAFGYESFDFTEDQFNYAISKSSLNELISALPEGIDSLVKERGLSLSGGQKQRLAIARALLTSPEILFLDEATSSLDSVSETTITNSITELKGSTTLIVVAHRLSTIIKADKFLYISANEIFQANSFRELRNLVPEFERQAQLMGL
jgi:ABC-type multidrug transport system fused ATPase/permease subunit